MFGGSETRVSHKTLTMNPWGAGCSSLHLWGPKEERNQNTLYKGLVSARSDFHIWPNFC